MILALLARILTIKLRLGDWIVEFPSDSMARFGGGFITPGTAPGLVAVVDAVLEGTEDDGLGADIDAGLGADIDAGLGADIDAGLEGVMEAAIDAGLGIDDCAGLGVAIESGFEAAGLGAGVVGFVDLLDAFGRLILIFPDPPFTLPVFVRTGAGKEAATGTAAGSIVRLDTDGGAGIDNAGAGGGSTS